MRLASLFTVVGQATLHMTIRVAAIGAAMESMVDMRSGTVSRRRINGARVIRALSLRGRAGAWAFR